MPTLSGNKGFSSYFFQKFFCEILKLWEPFMLSNNSNDENCMILKIPHAAIAAILAYAMGAGTVYAVSKNSQRQESLQTQKVEQIVCP